MFINLQNSVLKNELQAHSLNDKFYLTSWIKEPELKWGMTKGKDSNVTDEAKQPKNRWSFYVPC